MVAINARTINGVGPDKRHFYYNNNRNHFWRVLQYLMEPRKKDKIHLEEFDIEGKKNFLNKNGIAICNLVSKVWVEKEFALDPSDVVLFEAQKQSRIEYKKVTTKTRKQLKERPKFFTCRKKKGVDLLLDGFCQKNKLDTSLKQDIWYWPTPTRCNPYKRSQLWRAEMEHYLKNR